MAEAPQKHSCSDGSHFDPLCILFVAKGTLFGDKMLFRYPSNRADDRADYGLRGFPHLNPFSVSLLEEDVLQRRKFKPTEPLRRKEQLSRFTDDGLALLFTVRAQLCDRRFEMKVGNLRYIGYPARLFNSDEGSSPDLQKILLFHIVFVVMANTPRSLLSCYVNISKQLAVGLVYEENRCRYLSMEAKKMLDAVDECAALAEADSYQSPYQYMLSKCQLARDLKALFVDICTKGIVELNINKWIHISYCVPHKAYLTRSFPAMEPDKVKDCLAAMRPYHAIVLLQSAEKIKHQLPLDPSPALIRVLNDRPPMPRSLRELALQTDLPRAMIFRIVDHLVHWGKATVIYPLAEKNVYVVSPLANLDNLHLIQSFKSKFPGENLDLIMTQFSIPLSLNEFCCCPKFDVAKQQLRMHMVLWLLKHRLLIQMHTYFHLVVPDFGVEECGAARGSHLSQIIPPGLRSDDSDASDSAVRLSPLRSIGGDELNDEDDKALRDQVTETEYAAIGAVANRHTVEDLRQFIKMIGFLRGCHHVEEIMYSLNMTRSEVFNITQKFHDLILTCTHEDMLSSVFLS